jgi:hypothetical protein
LVLSLPLAISFIKEPITSRLASTNILKLWPFVPSSYPKFVFNPFYSFLWQTSGQFMAYYSPYNLFIRGSQEPGQYIPTLGLLNFAFPFQDTPTFQEPLETSS